MTGTIITPQTIFATAPVSYEGLVATRCRVHTLSGPTIKQFNSRSTHFARDTITSLKVAFANWMVAVAGANENGPGGSATYTASIEYPSGTFTQLLFSGSSSGTAADGATIWTDYLTVSIPRGAQFWVRAYGVVFGAIYASLTNIKIGDLFEFTTTTTTDKTLGGTIPNNGGGGALFYPLAIVGQTIQPSVLLGGDSIVQSSTEASSSVGNTTGQFGEIGMLERIAAPYFAHCNIGVFGETAQNFAAGTNSAKRQTLIPYCSHFITEWGNNDIFVNSRSAAQLAGNLQTIWAMATSAGKRAIQTTITSRSTSTDSYATAVNQTTNANESIRQTFLTNLRAGNYAGVSGYLETAYPLEDSPDNGKYITNGSAFFYTPDGTHGTTFAYVKMASNPTLISQINTLIRYP